ncbi:MAG: bifunctional DNA-formamidopyrimidine glycosylase/DNA-(apurinic or apyrimidinic site) lyase [Caldilineaceae bacterium]|nr:bifunctional DNA-formamidopyrimidine glycosylase/DNA-(apurinic or apyrimidinic site) lyase [Caldilineaceae bacterium]MBP8109490.1 bifunctional DNA-formamidopyrimidine glycosylase/DNA-(apurinic or apyrimidinic site) lyase [Caldilineaceae bacterium]MBP8124315.1 bifunctional DNA-formamidopyrimidine glycosylase/DNA-(apurinic or apyrimidinic site) lyase [Caldilineaceae bacterium]MBP9074106.1 bifunctional DNA-formamidopyrimidine glycosylase/DNA-(apurinic or apyrimidinic site) lyase [Caldilineaceae 
MPELPEVETYIREIAVELRGRQVQGGRVLWPRTVADLSPEAFLHGMRGRRFVDFGRRGKYMLLGLDNGQSLIVHLRMTGELRVESTNLPLDKHARLVLDLDGGLRLRFSDQRKFGRMWLVADPQSVLHRLGPEPLAEDFTPDLFGAALAGRKASIKALLLDQSIVAGVGNIYADEALFLARIHPTRKGGSLSAPEVAALHQAVRDVLTQGIEMRGSSLQNYTPPTGEKGSFQDLHKVFRRTGQPCPVCGCPIERMKLAQRSTHFCPHCQD